MVFMGLKFMDEVPFNDVLIHGLIRDSKGKKMSKSARNGIDPLEVIEQYGADALRLVMVHGVSQESDIRWTQDKIIAARNFANKLWNAARFVLSQLTDSNCAEVSQGSRALPDNAQVQPLSGVAPKSIEDKWLLSKYNRLVREVTRNLDSYDLGVAVGKIHDFIWGVYCDWYIELVKPRMRSGDTAAQNVLVFVMDGFLKLLHPFLPFITEEIWQTMHNTTDSIMVAKYPEWDAELDFAEEEAQFDKEVERIKDERAAAQAKEDRVKEIARLEKEQLKARNDIEFISGKLANEAFVTKAPPAQVENERAKSAKAKERLAEVEAALQKILAE
jgi:valyl-tRNA synthetase